ncbi:MAG: OmpA family protein [Bacteroidia bacterium]|nr:OmpA family protein [Bacteroidia bacterium]
MVKKSLFILFIVFFWSTFSEAQIPLSTKNKKAIALYTEADNYRVRGQFNQAISLLQQAIEKDRGFTEAYFRLGLTYKMMRDLDRSTKSFEAGLYLTADQRKQKGYFYELGENYLQNGIYEKARDFLTRYLDSEMLNKQKIDQATFWKRTADYAIKNRRNISGFVPRPLSDTVNCFSMQYFPVLTADEQELIFTRRLGASNDDDEDLVISKKDSLGNWQKPESISPNVNSEFNEGTCTISADGRQLIFTSCLGRKGFGNCDLFQSLRVGTTWSEPLNMGPQINSAAWESQPSLSADGRVLYFLSDRKGGLGSRDIYVSYQIEPNKWTKAENLGPKINTPYDEISPFIHVNGRTLFFAANGRLGFGGYDLYRSERENGEWQEPVNFGYPVNNHEDQFSLFITADGKRGFYSHEEGATNTSGKIYEITVPDDLQIKFRSNYVKGKVKDRKTGELLNARIELYDVVKNELISTVESDSLTGKYLMVLTQGSEYGLFVSKKDYVFQSLNFNYESDINIEPVVVDVLMDKVTVGASTILKNIFFEFDKYDLQDKSLTELEKMVRFLTENPQMRVEIGGHTDNDGTPAYNIKLSQNRAQSVANYLTEHGIDVKRISQKGYGADRPIKPNDSEENKQANRRIEFKILK